FYPVGLVMDKWGRKWVSVPSAFVLAVGMAFLPLTIDFWTFLAAGVLTGFGNGLGSGSMMTLGSDLAPANRAGEFLGVWRLIGDAGASSGPTVVGLVGELLTVAWASVWVASMGAGGGLILVFLVPETLRKPEPEPPPGPAPTSEKGPASSSAD
ncbi:MAG: MFS transporter, partial [Chloroflexota bacterium]